MIYQFAYIAVENLYIAVLYQSIQNILSSSGKGRAKKKAVIKAHLWFMKSLARDLGFDQTQAIAAVLPYLEQ